MTPPYDGEAAPASLGLGAFIHRAEWNEVDGEGELAPSLAGLSFLAGEWEMELSEAQFLPDGETVTADAVFEVADGGRFLILRQGDAATWMIGRDDTSELYTVLYSDARGVSRVYAMTLDDRTWRIWRDDPEFSQRFEGVVSAERDLISGRWEKRAGLGAWEHDFAVTYRRLR